MSKSDDLPAGEAICDHCGQQRKVYMGVIGAFYFGRTKSGKAIIRWLCRGSCYDAIDEKAKAWMSSQNSSNEQSA